MNRLKPRIIVLLFIISSLLISGCAQEARKIANPDIQGKFVFKSLREGKGVESEGIYVLKNGKLKLITHKGGFPKWSPDGKIIACYGKKIIWFYDEEGNLKKTIETKYQPEDFDWSIDGNFIMYCTSDKINEKKYNRHIIQLSLNDNHEVILASFFDKNITFNIYSLNISPDGKRVIFHVSDVATQGDDYIYLMDIDGSNLKKIRTYGGVMSWFPDSTNIAFYTNRDENGNLINNECGRIYKMNVDTGNLSIIEETTHLFYKDERISKDGKYMYYARPAQGDGHQIAICPVGERQKEIPVTYSYFVNPSIKYTNDRHPDWFQGE